MPTEFMSYTPYNQYERYADKTHDLRALLLRRPLVEFVERYNWLGTELRNDRLKFPLLEVGSGSSWGLKQLQDQFGNELVVGLDLNLNALEEGKSHGVSAQVVGDLTEELPFENNLFNTVVSFLVSEQIDPKKLNEVFRFIGKVTTPQAKLVIATFNRDLFSPRGRKWFTPNQREYSSEEMELILRGNGWISEKKLGQRFVEPNTYNIEALVTQHIGQALLHIPGLRDDPRVRIFSPRVLNIAPSIIPYASVRPIDKHTLRKPVISLMICHKAE